MKELVIAYIDNKLADFDITEHSEFIDYSTVIKIYQQCVSASDMDENEFIIVTKVFSILGMVLLIFYFVLIIKYRRKKTIIRASSWRLVIVMIIGALVGLCYPWMSLSMNTNLNDTSNLAKCFLRPFIMQFCVISVMGALAVKTWRLERIWSNSLKLKAVLITDKQMFIILACIVVIPLTILTIVLSIDPYILGISVFDGEYFITCSTKDGGKNETIAESILLLSEVIVFMLLGGYAWKLRNLNQQFNESKLIALVLYNNTIFIVLILFFFNFTQFNPITEMSVVSLLWCLMVIVNLSVLLVPKFLMIYNNVR